MRPWLCALVAFAAVGCKKADSLVVISVSAAANVADIATLHTVSTATGMSVTHDVVGAAPFTIPPAKTFGVQVPAGVTGSFTIHVEADDAAGNVLAAGDGTGTIVAGRRADVDVMLVVGGGLPPIVSEPVWIGSGGSATGGSSSVNLSFGGSDVIGSDTGTGGGQVSFGFFSSQTNE